MGKYLPWPRASLGWGRVALKSLQPYKRNGESIMIELIAVIVTIVAIAWIVNNH